MLAAAKQIARRTVPLGVRPPLGGRTRLVIYKQFIFCRSRASAYTNVDRLCAIFLYNGRRFNSKI